MLAILIAVGTLTWQIYQDIQDNKEELVIHSYQADPEYKFKITKSDSQVTIPFQFKILLANTGDISVPIINFKEQLSNSKPVIKTTNALSDVGLDCQQKIKQLF